MGWYKRDLFGLPSFWFVLAALTMAIVANDFREWRSKREFRAYAEKNAIDIGRDAPPSIQENAEKMVSLSKQMESGIMAQCVKYLILTTLFLFVGLRKRNQRKTNTGEPVEPS